VIVSGDGDVSVGRVRRDDLGSDVASVAVDGDEIVTGSNDGTIRVDGTPVAAVDGPVAFLAGADGALLAASGDTAWVVAAADPAAAPAELAIGDDEHVLAVAVSPHDGRLGVAVDGPDGPAVRTWRRGRRGRYQRGPVVTGHVLEVDAVVFDESGRILTGSDDRTVRVVDDHGDVVQVLGGYGDGVISLALDGDRLWSSTQNGEVHAWQLVDARYVRLGDPVRVDGSRVHLALGRPGELVVATSTRVRSWDVAPQALVDRACRLAGRSLTEHERQALALDAPEACS
jgi:WD40 repeat protein